MNALFSILHVVVCLVLIAAVLLQSGKAADLAGAFGGGGSATAFGPRGSASLMARITTVSAILFMVTSLILWLTSAPSKGSRMSGAGEDKPAVTDTQAAEGRASDAEKPPVKPPEQPK
ncbi:MAG: preprotein translocase subunit SecG [Candidatus Aminicenantes bacterium RBG_13_63_10]|nr:MAG: preprotein translocase subunit SecG [Candidatus Aminicenantes bacterium RBG_13_63_10]